MGENTANMIKGLMDNAVRMERELAKKRVAEEAREKAEGKVLELLKLPGSNKGAGGDDNRARLRRGELDHLTVRVAPREKPAGGKGNPLAGAFLFCFGACGCYICVWVWLGRRAPLVGSLYIPERLLTTAVLTRMQDLLDGLDLGNLSNMGPGFIQFETRAPPGAGSGRRMGGSKERQVHGAVRLCHGICCVLDGGLTGPITNPHTNTDAEREEGAGAVRGGLCRRADERAGDNRARQGEVRAVRDRCVIRLLKW